MKISNIKSTFESKSTLHGLFLSENTIQNILINPIINSGTYPNILKLSRITPILKPDKDISNIDSFRPINNLITLDKIIEQHIKTNLETYLDKNNIIISNHHGSRRHHGTNTAGV